MAVASPLFAEQLRERTRTPVVVLEQATDSWVMHPEPRAELAHELVYVANSRGVLRPIAAELLDTERDLAIWGSGWDGLIDTARVVGEHVPNGELRHVYSSAGIVLNDHWEDMREHGYISNRIYDALACGTLVLSDDVPGLSERFGEAVAVYRSAAELEELIERLLADPAELRRRGELGRAAVLAEHTFARRVDDLLEIVAERVREPRHARRLRHGGGLRRMRIWLSDGDRRLLDGNGYGQVSAAVSRGLIELGHDVQFQEFPGMELALFVCPPDKIKFGRQVRSAAITMHELDELPEAKRGWVEILNRLDLVITPTSWNRRVWERAGVRTPIEVVPLGIDVSAYYPVTGRRCTFLCVHENLGGETSREDWRQTLRAYLEAFTADDAVRLLIKTWKWKPAEFEAALQAIQAGAGVDRGSRGARSR